MTLDDFNAQLSTMENTLLGYYTQKTQLTGLRESLRFQYITAQKSNWSALLGAMMQQAYSQNNSSGVDLLTSITSAIQSATAMADNDGNPVTGWLPINPGNAGSGGGVTNAGFLSPIENILSKPFYGPTNPNQNPAYKIYAPTQWNAPTDSYLLVVWPQRLQTVDRAKGGTIDFYIPPSQNWCLNYFTSNMSIVNNLNTSYPFAASVIAATYTGIGSVQSVMDGFKSLLSQIVYNTQLLISLQIQIDSAASDLTNFVSSYAAFGSSVDVAQVLLNLQNAAEIAANPPPPPPPPQPVTVSVIPQPIIQTTPPVVATTTSKLPYILGGLALAALTMGKKK